MASFLVFLFFVGLFAFALFADAGKVDVTPYENGDRK